MAIKYLDSKRIRGSSLGGRVVRKYAYATDYSTTVSATNLASDNSDWVSSDSSNSEISSDRLNFTSDASEDVMYYDLQNANALNGNNADDEKWVLRFTYNVTSKAHNNYHYIGLSSTTTDGGEDQDQISWFLRHPQASNTKSYGCHDIEDAAPASVAEGNKNGFDGGVGTTYYFELARTSATTYAIRKYQSSDYDSLDQSEITGSCAATLNNLRYIKITGSSSSDATYVFKFDNVKFWNGVVNVANAEPADSIVNAGTDEKATLVTTLPNVGTATWSNLNGTVTLASSVTTPSGLGDDYWDFDSESERMGVAANIFGDGTNAGLTMSFWLYSTQAFSTDNHSMITGTGVPDGNKLEIQFNTAGNTVAGWEDSDGGGINVTTAAHGMAINTWYNLILTVTNATSTTDAQMHIYINNVLKSSPNDTTWNGSIQQGRTWGIGNTVNNNEQWFGKMMEFATWNKVLNSTERAAIYNSGNGRLATSTDVAGIDNMMCYYAGDDFTNDLTGTASSNLPENTLFEETDTQLIYWLQNNKWQGNMWSGTHGYAIGGTGSSVSKISVKQLNVRTTAEDKSTLAVDRKDGASAQNGTYIWSIGGNDGAIDDTIDQYTIGSSTQAADKGNLANPESGIQQHAYSATHAYILGGYTTARTDMIQDYQLGTSSSSDMIANLSQEVYNAASGSDGSTYAYLLGGGHGGTETDGNRIDQYQMGTDTDSTDKSSLANISGVSNGVYGTQGASTSQNATFIYYMGGNQHNSVEREEIEEYTMGSGVTATDKANLLYGHKVAGGCSSPTHGYTLGGAVRIGGSTPSDDLCQEYQHGTTTTAADKGNLVRTVEYVMGGASGVP